MIVKIDDWVFEVNITVTMEYSAKEAAEHCDCGYCRNFYATVDKIYPQLRPFFAQFGVDIEAPDELMPYDIHNEMCYEGFYAVCGNILQTGSRPITVDNAVITPDRTNSIGINVYCPEPYFLLNLDRVVLSWDLEEPIEGVISPANEPSFLRRMWDRLFGKTPKDILPS